MQVKSGYKQTEVGIIPSDWEVKSLESFSDRIGDGIHTTPKYSGSGDYIFINGNNLNNGQIIISEETKRVQKREYLIHKRDLNDSTILLSINGTIGNIALYNDENVVLGKSIAYIKLNDRFDRHLFYYVLQTQSVRNYFNDELTGTTIKNLGLNALRNTPIPLPPTKAEQTAIATALSDADALINALEKLITKKRLIKQGAMQEILRPKEGWEVKRLGEVIHLQGGYAFKSQFFTEIGVPIIRISDVFNYKIDTTNSICYQAFSIPKEFIAQSGDALIAMSGATTGKIGVYYSDKISYINQRVGKFIIIDSETTSKQFISHIVRSEKFRIGLSKLLAQGAQPNISGNQIESIEFSIPQKKSEQIYIAQILSDMDTEIEALESKLEKYKRIKQGMMEELLTGKKRLV